MRIPGVTVWATQFHPELSGDENLARFKRYLEGYASIMSQDERADATSRFGASPETLVLIPRFLDLVFG